MSDDPGMRDDRLIEDIVAEASAVFDPETDLRALMRLAHENSTQKGFHEYGRELRRRIEAADSAGAVDELAFLESGYQRYLGNALMLLVGEASEAHEEVREGRAPNETYFEAALHHDRRDSTAQAKPLGFASELADIFIRLLDTAQELGIDLPGIVAMKMQYNASRGHMHGKAM